MKIRAISCFCGLLASITLAYRGRDIAAEKAAPAGQTENVVRFEKPLMGVRMIETEEKMRIQSNVLGKNAYFTINDYALSPSGENIYLLDSKDFKVYVFDAAGKSTRVIRIPKGQGPEEFEGAYSGIRKAYPRKEGLWIEDYGKIALFDHQGKFILGKNKFQGGTYFLIQGISPERFLAIKDERSETADMRTGADGPVSATQHFQLEDRDGRFITRYFSSDKTGGWGCFWMAHVSDFRITPLIVFDDDPRNQKLVYAVSDEYSLFVKDLNGKTLQTIRRDFKPQKITGKIREDIMSSPLIRQLAEVAKQDGQDFRDIINRNQTFDHLNPIKKIQFLTNGMICVFVLKDAQGRFETDIFDRQGRWLTTLQFQEAAQKLKDPRLRDNRLVGLVVNEEEGDSYYIEYLMKNIPAALIK